MCEMKDSGIEWIGNIPNGWHIEKGKYCFTSKKEIPGIYSGKYKRLALTLRGVVDRSKDDAEGLQPKDFNTYQLLRENELVFKLIDLQNASTSRVGLSHSTGLVSPAYIILRTNEKIVPSYAEKFYLMMWHRKIFNVLGDNGVRSNLGVSDLLNVPISVPPICEQKRIADFLDSKCSEIDAISADIQKEIETLEQYKRSVITEAVTKGVNPDVEMKDSGVQWIGKIPANWTCIKGKYILKYMQKQVKPNDGVITCFRDGEVTLRSNRREDGFTMADKEIGYQGIDAGDLVVHGMDGFAGAIGISDSRGKASPVLNVLDSRQDKKYIMYYLRSMAYGDVFAALATGIRVRSCDLRWNKLSELLYPVPSLEEQAEIVKYIEDTLKKANAVIGEKKQQLDVLDSYKKSLIYEYVTGKKEVLV